jgi:hypothetical protein
MGAGLARGPSTHYGVLVTSTGLLKDMVYASEDVMNLLACRQVYGV